jgi:hypothetical protein
VLLKEDAKILEKKQESNLQGTSGVICNSDTGLVSNSYLTENSFGEVAYKDEEIHSRDERHKFSYRSD